VEEQEEEMDLVEELEIVELQDNQRNNFKCHYFLMLGLYYKGFFAK